MCQQDGMLVENLVWDFGRSGRDWGFAFFLFLFLRLMHRVLSLCQANMSINPAALLPSQMSKPATSHRAQPQQPVIADLDQPAHVQPLHSIVKVHFISLFTLLSVEYISRCLLQHHWTLKLIVLPMEPASFITPSTLPQLWFPFFCFPCFHFLGCISSLIIYNSLSFTAILKPISTVGSFLFLQDWLHSFPTASDTSEIFCFFLVSFITTQCYAKCGVCRRRVCVCVCVCVSVTLRYSIKTAKRRITQIMPYDSPLTLVFWHQSSRLNLKGITPCGGNKWRWGGLK